MKVLGLTFARNAEMHVQSTLDSMADFCDFVYAVDDRSTDGTSDILRCHPIVSNVFTVDHRISDEPWHFSESRLLGLLYRMADLCQPDWVVMLSADESIEPGDTLRERLCHAAAETSGFQMYLSSAWNDPRYPYMVPVMGQARNLVGRIWRYYPGLEPGTNRLHNSYFPRNISEFGRVEFLGDVSIAHAGWSTLADRIAKVDLYTSLDPNLEWNDGVPYDIGLLFGYERHRIGDLVQEYERRIQHIRTNL